MSTFSNWMLKYKILTGGLGVILALAAVLFELYAVSDRKKSVEAQVEKARMVCLLANSALEEMESKWKKGLFSRRELKEMAEKGDMERFFAAVPVSAAWQVAMRKAEEGGYQFRTPSFHPRNPLNAPDYGLDYEIEKTALHKMESENLDEHYVIDPHRNAVRYFLALRLTPECLICHGDPSVSGEIWGRSDGTDPTGTPMEGWREGEMHGAFEIIQDLDAADAALKARMLKAGLAVISAVCITGLILWGLASGISRPLRRLEALMEQVKTGDLTPRIRLDSGDEIGRLGQGFNGLLDHLNGMIERIVSVVNTLTDSVSDISSSVNNQTDIANEQSASVTEITSAMAQLSATSTEIAAHSEKVAGIADRALDMTRSGAGSVETVTGKMQEIDGQNRKKIRQIVDLGKKTAEIGKVMEIINNITDQTKLIAFNAALEASSAGESGKRFSVVAAEIRRLADNVMDSTGEIESKINEIQEAVNRMTVESEKGSREIALAMEFTAGTNEKLGVIVEGVRETTEAAGQISLSTRQQKIASEQVVITLKDIDRGARQNSEAIARINAISRKLNVLSGNLQTLVNQFKL